MISPTHISVLCEEEGLISWMKKGRNTTDFMIRSELGLVVNAAAATKVLITIGLFCFENDSSTPGAKF